MSKKSKQRKYGKTSRKVTNLGQGMLKLDTCQKRKYSQTGALYAIVTAKHKQIEGEQCKIPIRSYWCYQCGFFHLTSQKKDPNTNESFKVEK